MRTVRDMMRDLHNNRHSPQKEQNRINAKKIAALCPVKDEHGNLVRGVVTQIRCACGAIRWDDGTPCKNIIAVTHRNNGINVTSEIYCGRYPSSVMANQDGENLEGTRL